GEKAERGPAREPWSDRPRRLPVPHRRGARSRPLGTAPCQPERRLNLPAGACVSPGQRRNSPMDDRIPCPYCAEDIRPAAIRCPHCRTRLTGMDPTTWHRDYPERRVAGVSAALPRGRRVSLRGVGVGFSALAFFRLLGPALYGLLWLVIPSRPGDRPPFEDGIARAKEIAGRLLHGSGSGAMPEGPRA